jgi:hypothetical protein
METGTTRSHPHNRHANCHVIVLRALSLGIVGSFSCATVPPFASSWALPPEEAQRMADIIRCPSGLQGRVRGMKVREERIVRRL